jgi:dipeptidyl aminopeptidase/acylaminoacyl peptidase
VFRANQGGRFDLWAVREKGDLLHKVTHEPVRLTAGPLNFEAPQPSADGKKIFSVGSQQRSELVRYDAKSAQFIPFFGGISATQMSFSRDGQWLSYITWPEGELWRCRPDGSEKLQLTSPPMVVESADWSPDGRQIAFTGVAPGERDRVYLVPATAGESRQIAGGGINIRNAGWSPDGNSLLLIDEVGPENSLLKFLDLKTMTLTTLPDSKGRQAPALSPDGKYIAAKTVDGQKLLLFEVGTHKWSELAPGSVSAIKWSGDSKYVFFDTQSSSDPKIFRVRISDRRVESVADLKDLRRAILPFFDWMGLTPDGSPLLMRDIGTQEVYALDFEEP